MDFYGQVVRLEKFKDLADRFIRVRLSRVIDADIHQLEFDFDLTMMTYFLSPEGKVYSRYGGRDSKDAENRLSLAGFRHTMESVLAEHAKKAPQFAERTVEKPQYPRDMNITKRGCLHCHNVKEKLESDLAKAGKWDRDLVWRFPPPDNVGLIPDVDRGNVVKTVTPESPAAKAGLKPGDQLRTLNRVPIHSFGDAQFALDRAPAKGAIDVAWERDGKPMTAKLELSEGWKKTDITWRASQKHRIPSLKLSGDDLTADEKKALGLKPGQLAFRQQNEVSAHAAKAGFKAGDVIVGVDDLEPELTASKFLSLVRRQYLVGDQVTVHIIRDGKRLKVPMKLIQ
jgi:predicted metalloprotease with PDZ domain